MRNTYVEVSLGTIQKNATIIKKHCTSGTAICAVIKADAYGHGMVAVAKALTGHAEYLAVALVTEGKLLRENGIITPILVLAAIDADEINDAILANLTITASSLEKLEAIADTGTRLGIVPKVHLKIDTGMGRIGVHFNRATDFIGRAAELHSSGTINCEGIYSHFSDSLDPIYTKLQFDRFMEVIAYAKSVGLTPPFLHICSSRSIFLYPEYHLSMVRPGIAIYGIEPEVDEQILPSDIQPALTWKTKVVYFKVVEQTEPVGYGRKYVPRESYERIVTLPVGYADGFPRRLSNCGNVVIRGKIYPVVGGVCMDQCMVSLGSGGEAYVGDEVILLGESGESQVKATDIARIISTASHEITTCISDRVPRIYTDVRK